MEEKGATFYLRIDFPGGSFRKNLQKEIVSIGSSDVSDIVVPDEALAPIHFHLRKEQSTYEVISPASETLLNGMPARIEPLRDGDSLSAGSTKITFHISGDVAHPGGEVLRFVESEEPPQEPLSEEPLRLREELPSGPPKKALPCPACGNEIQLDDEFRRFCGTPLGEKAFEKARKESGDWSVLGPSGAATPGVKFKVLLKWIENGRINRYTTVKGPTTGYEWKSACEVPRLSKHFGVCYRCNAGVEPNWDFCKHCGADLDGKGRVPPGKVPETFGLKKEKAKKPKAGGPRKRLTLAAKIVIAVSFFAIAISALRLGLWRTLAPASWQSAVSEASVRFVHALKVKIGPEKFPGERHRLDEAKMYLRRKSYGEAISISEAIIADFPGTRFAQMAEELRSQAEEERQIHSLLEKGKNFALNAIYDKALETYRLILSEYPDHPMSEQARERIEEILNLQKASDSPAE